MLTFPTTDIQDNSFYAITMYFGGSAVTDLSNTDLLTGDIYTLGEPAIAYGYDDSYVYPEILLSGTSINVSYMLDKITPYAFTIEKQDVTGGAVSAQAVFKGSELKYWTEDAYCGLMFKLYDNAFNSSAFVLVSLTAVVDETDVTDAMQIISAIGQQTQEIVAAIESGDQKIVDELITQNEALMELIQGEPQDTSVGSELAGAADEYSSLDAEANDFVDGLYEREVEINGQTYSLSMSANTFDVLQDAYGTYLDNFSGGLTYSATLFRRVLDSLIGVFGILIFFPLTLGLIGALMGRYRES